MTATVKPFHLLSTFPCEKQEAVLLLTPINGIPLTKEARGSGILSSPPPLLERHGEYIKQMKTYRE